MALPAIILSGAVVASATRWVLSALGVGVVVFVGLSSLLDQVTAYALDTFDGLPLAALQIAGLLKVDVALNVILSAYGINLSMMAVRVLRRA